MAKITNAVMDAILDSHEKMGNAETAKALMVSASAVARVLRVYHIVESGDWDSAAAMLNNNNSYAAFEWAAARVGIDLPKQLRQVHAEHRKAERVRKRKQSRAGLLTVNEYARQTGASLTAVYRKIKAGELSVVKLKKDDSNREIMCILADRISDNPTDATDTAAAAPACTEQAKPSGDATPDTSAGQAPSSSGLPEHTEPCSSEICMAETSGLPFPFRYTPTLRLKDIIQILRTESPIPMGIADCPVKLVIGYHDFSDVTVTRYHRLLEMFGEMFIVSIGATTSGQLLVWLDPGETEP